MSGFLGSRGHAGVRVGLIAVRRGPSLLARGRFTGDAGGRVGRGGENVRGPAPRERLMKCVVEQDRAQTKRTRSAPRDVRELWQGLLSGAWSLVDRFERDGRRYVVVGRAEDQGAGARGLSPRQRDVIGHLVRGDSLKATAYELGLAMSTVSQVASAVCLKLGMRNIAALTAFAAFEGAAPPDRRDPEGARMLAVDFPGRELYALSVPLVDARAVRFTPSEMEVARALLRGATNVEIARARGTSRQTVAKQVASVFRRLGVQSRAQAAAKLALLDLGPAGAPGEHADLPQSVRRARRRARA